MPNHENMGSMRLALAPGTALVSEAQPSLSPDEMRLLAAYRKTNDFAKSSLYALALDFTTRFPIPKQKVLRVVARASAGRRSEVVASAGGAS